MSYGTFTLTGRHTTPSGIPHKGQVVVTPNTIIRDTAGLVVMSGSVQVPLDETGAWSLVLPCDDPSLNPSEGIGYKVGYALHSTSMPQQSFYAASDMAGSTLDVSEIVTVSVPTPLSAIVGPRGEPGPVGPPGAPARQVVIDANLNGVIADGVTDDAAAWNAIVAAAPDGSIITWTGRSVLKSAILWKSNISLHGQGWGKSVLAPVDTTGTKHFPAIGQAPGAATAAAPWLNNTFRDFEVDGSGISTTTFNVADKAIFMQYMKRAQFLNLYCHDTGATGLGMDLLTETIIDGCFLHNCGRNWDGTSGGAAGIGIGTGGWEDETVTVSNCHVTGTGLGQWGIFFEAQILYVPTMPFSGRGYVITGCSAQGSRYGFGDMGTLGTTFDNCTAYGNGDGFLVGAGAQQGSITDCTAHHNSQSGIRVRVPSVGNYRISRNRCYSNTQRGIYVAAGTEPFVNLTIEDNECYLNQMAGVRMEATTSGLGFPSLKFNRNRLFNNGLSSEPYGLYLAAVGAGMQVNDNRCFDDRATKTQTDGMRIGNGSGLNVYSDSQFERNHLIGNATIGFNRNFAVLTSSSVIGNKGYNPVGPSAVTVTASPMTYTASYTPETLYINGGTVTNVKKGAITIHGAGDCVVNLAPGESCIVTYTAAPTMVADKR
ncbi:right-handed parallel beta-helix repeat-containing protein [Terrabacter sp. C0L_2]|uniref:right-handed parallel beta-helix repeat-containing protein n=1 Tax=Terrabacter sp. C0L_2 TaxID=3108389 RepID=UPI002ED0D127|nr:right-handed parallel beta-helix repeat-containing protein [Terrabacter sp. C0L_2]